MCAVPAADQAYSITIWHFAGNESTFHPVENKHGLFCQSLSLPHLFHQIIRRKKWLWVAFHSHFYVIFSFFLQPEGGHSQVPDNIVQLLLAVKHLCSHICNSVTQLLHGITVFHHGLHIEVIGFQICLKLILGL